MLKQQKGVTLVALVITIIVLLILAGVSIAMLTGDNGVLTKAKESSSQTTIAEEREAAQIDINAAMSAWYEAKYTGPDNETKKFDEYLKENSTLLEQGVLSTATDTEKKGKKYTYTITGEKVTTITTIHKNKSEQTESATIDENGGLSAFTPNS